jgi:beta-lactamase superfamily II metal-dependent hydrolase
MDEAYEIDFLPVGNGECSGDAICIRYGTPGNYKVMVYDGGTKESGEKLVEHIRQHYGTSHVDYVVCSHPDADHASGLSVVLENLSIGELWMHRPWEHSAVIRDYFKDGRITDASLAERLKDKMAAAYALEELALEKDIPLYEPFKGSQIGAFHVMSPSKDWYVHSLIPDFAKSPEKKQAAGVDESIFKSLYASAKNAVAGIAESWGFETLREDVSTSAENESSVVLYAVIAERGILLTGDAGIQALSDTATYAESQGVSLPDKLKFTQVPHHGSRNNVSPSVLDRLIGPKTHSPVTDARLTTFVSAAKESDIHPRKMVVNGFLRRGASVMATKGQSIRHHYNMDVRNGWGAIESISFSEEVESWD